MNSERKAVIREYLEIAEEHNLMWFYAHELLRALDELEVLYTVARDKNEQGA